MQRQILAFFGYKDFTLAGRTCPYLHALWQKATDKKRLPLYVPEDCKTLKEAVTRVAQEPRITTIVLGRGEHHIDGPYLYISSAMSIVGRPDVPTEKIVVVGGIWFTEGIPGNCHLQHLTVRQAKDHGVVGESSFTMADVVVEQCGHNGVYASGTGVVCRCTNVRVHQCGWSAVMANGGAFITLIGAKTTVHHNCTDGISGTYGLLVYRSSSSTIQLVFPLTKEQVSIDNGGGGNWGAWRADINQIKTIAVSPDGGNNGGNNGGSNGGSNGGNNGGKADNSKSNDDSNNNDNSNTNSHTTTTTTTTTTTPPPDRLQQLPSHVLRDKM